MSSDSRLLLAAARKLRALLLRPADIRCYNSV